MRSDKTKIISFSGIDGAGKSTQVGSLQTHLQALGFRTILYTFWDNIVVFSGLRENLSLKAFKGDKGVGSPEQPIRRRDKNVTSWYVTAFRLFLYFLDACSLRVARMGGQNAGVDFIIFDRYIYDELANLPLTHRGVLLYARLVLSLAPKPDVAFLVDADPEAAHQRKPEYPLEFVRANRASYIALSGLIRSITVLDPLDIEKTSAKINESIAKLCLGADSRTSASASETRRQSVFHPKIPH